MKLEAAEAVVCGLLRSQDEAEWRPVEVRGLASCTSHCDTDLASLPRPASCRGLLGFCR